MRVLPILCFVATLLIQPGAQAAEPTGPDGSDVSAAGAAPMEAAPVDVMLVLDNSGSMKKNDPQGLMREVVSTFVQRLSAGSRLGIVVFDERASVPLTLSSVDATDFQDRVAASLESVNYRGQRTDIPAGVERAIYDLRMQGRPHVDRLIIFLTDGMVDTGNIARDVERTRWLREDLAQDAKRLGIRIFGIAFTHEADFELIQSVARATGGEHYRVLAAADIASTFERIGARIAELARDAEEEARRAAARPSGEPAAPGPVQVVVPNPVVVQVRARDPWQWLLVSVAVLVVGVMFVVALRTVGSRATRVLPATLYDLSGQSGKEKHAIKKARVTIGRDSSNDIVLPAATVSTVHAAIKFRDGRFYIEDNKSRNGTKLNGKRFSDPESVQERPLTHGDRICFDAYECEFLVDGVTEAKGDTKEAAGGRAGGTILRPVAPAQEPPPPVRPVAGDRDPAPNRKKDDKTRKKELCRNCGARDADAQCEECRAPFCEQCLQQHNGKTVCVKCAGRAA